MLTKVLVIYSQSKEKNLIGLLSLKNENGVFGSLKFFENFLFTELVIKIGENTLLFSQADITNFKFQTIFHNLNQDICAIFVFNGKIVGVAQTENSSFDAEDVFKEFLKQQHTKTQSLEKQEKDEESENSFNIKKDGQDLKEKIENTDNFFEMIKPQIDVLFEQNERFSKLEEKIEGTQWVKVNLSDAENDHYILGKIFDGDVLTHIAYGIYAKSQNEKPPEGLEKFCQFMPLNPQDENGEGYFVMYQDALTGENVEM